ncbi:hypothetical protein [Gimesia algae]|uniref:Uncharacterized protein n=1 Tax=Gimesia algae TaxID=2527971 RepID=A0A517VN09_9PLAN|nr:hypothetical protein [Gimesia algae]QDT94300.1 hypothetical protein Pan161_59950 [Gimesia algae]
MITERNFKAVLIGHDVDFNVLFFYVSDSKRICNLLLGDKLVSIGMTCRVLIIGNDSQTHTWDDWFRFDETDIEYRGIDLTWWCNHKPVLQELVHLIETQTSKTDPVSKPANCRPDICPQ